MLTLPRTAFRAAVISAATKDIRYYLIGVRLERASDGALYVVSTDGTRLFVGIIRSPQCERPGPWALMVPLAVAKAAAKGKGSVTLRAMPDGRYELADQIFAPVDGPFPDWRRVVPSTDTPVAPSQLNFQFVADAQEQVMLWSGCKVSDTHVHLSGANAAVVNGLTGDAFGAVMPLRNTPPRIRPPKFPA